MKSIITKLSSKLSKMWTKIINLEKTLFPALKEELRLEEVSNKEEKRVVIDNILFNLIACVPKLEPWHERGI